MANYEYCAAVQNSDGSRALVGVEYGEDVYPDAKDRAMEHHRAWSKSGANCILVRRLISPWEVVE